MTREELGFRAVGLTGGALLLAICATLRFEVEGAEHYLEFRKKGHPVVFALWHSRLLPLAYVHRNQNLVVLASRHRDGEYVARVVQRLGLDTARGSSTRGGARGMRELVRAAREGRDLAITPDGPVGPAREVKMGLVTLARLTGAPVIPVTVGGHRVWRLNSWDRFLVPKPFARLQVRYAPPLWVPRQAQAGELERLRLRIQDAMNRITDEVDAAPGATA